MSPQSSLLLFLVECSPRVGTGHLRRCSTLARHLNTLGWKTEFQIFGPPSELLPQAAIASILGDLPWYPYTSPLSRPAKVVIVDVTPALQKAAVVECRDQNLPCIALDYLQPDLLPDEVVTLRDLSGFMREAFEKAKRPQTYHEGVEYAMMRPSILRQRAHAPLPGQNGVLDVMVTLGGADPKGLTLEAIDLLRPWRNRLGQVTIVLGPGVGRELEAQVCHAAAQLAFNTVKAPANFDEILSHTDLVLCNGGGTVLEALFLGRLVAVLPQTDAESAFSNPFCQQQACVWAREIGRIIETTEQERLEFARRAASIVDGQGLNRLTALISSLANLKN
ncbi:hypothetical protein [Prosthecobacter dejongeii]|uniref:Spore coat polysaccharide biosynthesis predicted glycosyltransferase SpsG n=1 Tax=Prosthecobacter dejongeii TaxID=48465 RepID=A0A7W8DQM5_9BACT|nr:hypothetical protein [Prosthecobacter dejongeii]MBB5038345.1 spore coat polysaccharide biosynthesis predicted glycosyltransferase SpsG [Prosthecobacter dejongeii]